MDRFFGITLDILNKPHLNMMKVFLMLTVNVIADFAGIAIFHSLYGVAIASLFTYYSGLIFGYIQLKKHLPVPSAQSVQRGLWRSKRDDKSRFA
jgi:Na+-driven multidrug efflux pump